MVAGLSVTHRVDDQTFVIADILLHLLVCLFLRLLVAISNTIGMFAHVRLLPERVRFLLGQGTIVRVARMQEHLLRQKRMASGLHGFHIISE